MKRLEENRIKAFDMLEKWVKKDANNVPKWMMSNLEFIEGLKECSTVLTYESLLEKFGTHYVVTVAQAVKIMQTENCDHNRIQMVANSGKIIIQFDTI